MDQRTEPTGTLKKHEAMIYQNRAMAARGTQAQIAGSEAVSIENAAPLVGGATISFSSAPFTPKVSGRVKVTAQWSGLASAVDLVETMQFVLDGGAAQTTPLAIGTAGHATADFSLSMSWIFTVTKNVAHTFGVQMATGGGGTSSVPAAGQVQITLEELPG